MKVHHPLTTGADFTVSYYLAGELYDVKVSPQTARLIHYAIEFGKEEARRQIREALGV
jgi:hypothetical protein